MSWVLTTLALPFLLVPYGQCLAWWADYLSPAPHHRLTLLLGYVAAVGRALLEPAPAICITSLLVVVLLKREVGRLIDRITELRLAGASLLAPRGEYGPEIRPPGEGQL